MRKPGTCDECLEKSDVLYVIVLSFTTDRPSKMVCSHCRKKLSEDK